MQNLGSITFKHKFGGALDLLLLAGAGALAVHGLVEIVDCGRQLKNDENNEKVIKMMEESNKNLKQAMKFANKAEEKPEEEAQ